MTQKSNSSQTHIQETAAEILTRILSPITATIVGLAVIYSTYITQAERPGYIWLIAAFGFFVAAILTLVVFYKTGLVSNWDITDRSQRPRFLALISFYIVILLLITYLLGYSEAMPVLTFLALSLVIASVITLFWKISFHTFAVTLCVLLLVVTTNEPYTLFLLILPIITAWTRVTLGKHTQIQAFGGILLGIVMLWMWNILSAVAV